jgi:AI-2E family transporter
LTEVIADTEPERFALGHIEAGGQASAMPKIILPQARWSPRRPEKDNAQLKEPDQIKLTQPRGTTLINLAVAALIIAALYFGREIFVPVALAVLLSFVLAPFVIRLHSWRVPRTVSVLVAVFFGFSIIFSLGGLMVSQATRLAAKLPGYQQTLSDKIESLRGLMGGSGTLEQASTVLKELGTELQHRDATGRPDSGSS